MNLVSTQRHSDKCGCLNGWSQLTRQPTNGSGTWRFGLGRNEACGSFKHPPCRTCPNGWSFLCDGTAVRSRNVGACAATSTGAVHWRSLRISMDLRAHRSLLCSCAQMPWRHDSLRSCAKPSAAMLVCLFMCAQNQVNFHLESSGEFLPCTLMTLS